MDNHSIARIAGFNVIFLALFNLVATVLAINISQRFIFGYLLGTVFIAAFFWLAAQIATRAHSSGRR